MDNKTLSWIYVLVGSTVGSSIPLLWGGNEFSFSSIFLGGVGAIAGIYMAFQQTH